MSETIKIPTAKEYLINAGCSPGAPGLFDYVHPQNLIDFTKLHVNTALEAAVKNATLRVLPGQAVLVVNSILEAYPDDKIV